jgi:uncharacterized membrane protein
MLTRHHGLQQQAPTLVKVDPNPARLRLLRILIVVIMLLWIASLMTDYSAFGSIAGRHVLPYVFLLDLFSLIVAFALFIFVGLFLTRFWKRLERRYRTSSRGRNCARATERLADPRRLHCESSGWWVLRILDRASSKGLFGFDWGPRTRGPYARLTIPSCAITVDDLSNTQND